MEFLSANFINTTTQLTLPDNTETAQNLFNTDLNYQYGTSEFADDNTTASLTISFNNTTTINRIALVDMNLKSFTLFYNGTTANTFSLTSTADTTVSDYSSNSTTSKFLRFASIDCTSVTIDMKTTIEADRNKVIGYMAVSALETDFGGRVPHSGNYRPVLNTKQVVHVLANGKRRVQNLEDNWEADFTIEHVTESVRDMLRDLYDEHQDLIFVPFGTATGWDNVIFQCAWIGEFNFYRYSDNTPDTGFTGSIKLVEVGI